MKIEQSAFVTGRTRLFAVALIVAVCGAFGAHLVAQSRPLGAAAAAAANQNFDIRRDDADGDYMLRLTGPAANAAAGALAADRIAGVALLKGPNDAVDVQVSPELGTLEVVAARRGAGFLSAPASDRTTTLRAFLGAHSRAFGVSPQQVSSLELVADYVNPAGNMAWVEFAQRINGLPVFGGSIRGAFTANNELAATTGTLAPGVQDFSVPREPVITGTSAVARAASLVGWNVAETALVEKAREDGGQRLVFGGAFARDAKAWLVYFPLASGVARLAWATQIIRNPDGFLIVTDAEDGTLLFKKYLTNYQTQSATYGVYTSDSPAPASPSPALPGANYQAPFVARTAVTLIGNEAPNTFNNLGWMTDGTNGTNGATQGNNVVAGMDLTPPDGLDFIIGGTGRSFVFTYDPSVQAPSTALYQAGEVTDTFYWSNRFHDSTYLLGFTEPALNFQNNNFGRGGSATDPVIAEGQDFSGTTNANFLTLPDGTPGFMQMYVFPGPTPDRSSGIDHDVLLHELAHGLSNRLHGNASGLTTTMAGGMGEGWSDFYARALLSTADEFVGGIYPAGGWVTYQIEGAPSYTDNYYYGIRRFPYAVKTTTGGPLGRPHNPLTFADVDAAQANISDGAYASSPIISPTPFEVHNLGEIWCMALLEVRARFIARLGFATGNQRILQFVTDGMKLDAVNPTFLSGRNSILTAANAGGGTAADIADIWAGFATRGMGTAANITSLTNFAATVVESFAVPVTAKARSDFNGDGRSDAGIFRPSVVPNALWYSTPTGGGSPFQIFFGATGDIPVPADYDGDSKADAVIWRPSTGLWYGPRNGAATIVIQLTLGQLGDIPVPCDYDGDGAIDPAIYRPSTGLWFGTRANGSTVVINTNLGLVAGDIPVPADFNGDGRCDPAIMRAGVGPSGTNLWYSVPSGGGSPFQIYFGAVGDIPAPGDYDGDGKADAVIFRPSTALWYGPRTGAGTIVIQLTLGQNADIPVAGDYDGNGATDPAIYRPSTGLFFGTNTAGNAVVLNTNLGAAAGDIPTPQRPHYQATYPFFTSMRNDRGNDLAADAVARASSGADVQSSGQAALPQPARVDYVALGSGRGSLVSVLDARTRAEVTRFHAFGGFANGIQVAVGDVNGDHVADIIAAADSGGGSAVEVFDGETFGLVYRFLAFPRFSGEVSVAAGDVTGDGRSDIVVGAANGHVKVFDGASGALVRSFRAFAGVSGSVSVAAGDVNGDGHADIVVGGAVNGHVKAFDGVTNALIYNFLADEGVAGAVNVAAGDVTGDGFADIITGSGSGSTHVQVFDGRTGEWRSSFLAFPGTPFGVRVGSADTNGDGIADIIAAPAGALPHVMIFDGASGGVLDSFFGLDPAGGAGVFAVGQGAAPRVTPTSPPRFRQ